MMPAFGAGAHASLALPTPPAISARSHALSAGFRAEIALRAGVGLMERTIHAPGSARPGVNFAMGFITANRLYSKLLCDDVPYRPGGPNHN